MSTDLVFEIIKVPKVKNLKTRRYSDNWMLHCLLFQIRGNLPNSVH